MLPSSTVFITASPTPLSGPNQPGLLLARQQASITTIRDPYIGGFASAGTTRSSYLNDLSIQNFNTVGNTTYWDAFKSVRNGVNSTFFVTDMVTRYDWRLHVGGDGMFSALGTNDIIQACDVNPIKLSPSQNMSTTWFESGVVHFEGSSSILIHDGLKSTPKLTSSRATGSASSGHVVPATAKHAYLWFLTVAMAVTAAS